jgi:hypothetical protein
MLLRTEKMDVESPADLGGVPAAVCTVDDDPSMLKAFWALARIGWLAGSVISGTARFPQVRHT